MAKDSYVVCAHRPWNIDMYNNRLLKLPYRFSLISDIGDLTLKTLKKLDPKIIFFLDWSWLVSKDILDHFVCVGFHSSPLPKFRGGSPIQNQINCGIYDTKLTAFFMTNELDAGDILLQQDLSLRGSLKEIFDRICDASYNMIKSIINKKYSIHKQNGDITTYKRRTPKQSELTIREFDEMPIVRLYDFIRMLEDPYPNATINTHNKSVVFKTAKFENNKIIATIEIYHKG